MKTGLVCWGLMCGLSVSAFGQLTNVQAEANSLRLEWKCIPGNPYYVFSTPDLMEPAWSNRMPDCVVFADAQGSSLFSMDEPTTFYCVAASNDYLVVDLSDGPDATNYPVSHLSYMPPGGWVDEYKTTKLVLRRIPGGNFTMGSPTNELGRDSDEPQHTVTLTQDYYIGVFEVTQKQWERVMGNWPSNFTNTTCRDSRPVEKVSYNDIRGTIAGTNWPADGNVDTNSFMGRMRTKTGQSFDLPTEAQWERACRAGTTSALYSGYELTTTSNDMHVAELGRYAFNGGNEGYVPRDVDASEGSAKAGSYLPNAWGVYDLYGNAWECCLDWMESDPSEVLDPKGATRGTSRVMRGGCWGGYAGGCRSAMRGNIDPGIRSKFYGFRICLPPGP